MSATVRVEVEQAQLARRESERAHQFVLINVYKPDEDRPFRHVQVAISATGRSIHVFVDGEELQTEEP